MPGCQEFFRKGGRKAKEEKEGQGKKENEHVGLVNVLMFR